MFSIQLDGGGLADISMVDNDNPITEPKNIFSIITLAIQVLFGCIHNQNCYFARWSTHEQVGQGHPINFLYNNRKPLQYII